MKKYVFAYVCDKRVARRTYGGTNYTLAVYELTGGAVKRIGTISKCTASHKGEDSEAWGVVLANRPKLAGIIKRRIMDAKKPDAHLADHLKAEPIGAYWTWGFNEYGVELHNLGGA